MNQILHIGKTRRRLIFRDVVPDHPEYQITELLLNPQSIYGIDLSDFELSMSSIYNRRFVFRLRNRGNGNYIQYGSISQIPEIEISKRIHFYDPFRIYYIKLNTRENSGNIECQFILHDENDDEFMTIMDWTIIGPIGEEDILVIYMDGIEFEIMETAPAVYEHNFGNTALPDVIFDDTQFEITGAENILASTIDTDRLDTAGAEIESLCLRLFGTIEISTVSQYGILDFDVHSLFEFGNSMDEYGPKIKVTLQSNSKVMFNIVSSEDDSPMMDLEVDVSSLPWSTNVEDPCEVVINTNIKCNIIYPF